MLKFIVLRIVRIFPITFAVITIIFLLFQAIPGDQAVLMAGPGARDVEIEEIRHQLGLDQPIYLQYVRHIAGILQGDFGFSTTYQGSPFIHIIDRIPATLALTVAAILVTIVIGVPGGILAAVYHNRLLDYGISLSVVGLLAVPNFWLGLLMMSFLSVQMGWLPSFGFSGWLSLVMPTLALAARLIALVARMTRGVVLEELNKDYVRTARSKGLDGKTVILRHVLRNALIPTVTLIGLETGYLLGGSVVVERLFAWPGIGDLMINAIGMRDYNLVQGIILMFVIGFLLINLIVEILYVIINPKIQYG
jgi:ABC-type dipeptide/oligopeptide/nickel transport system permease component